MEKVEGYLNVADVKGVRLYHIQNGARKSEITVDDSLELWML